REHLRERTRSGGTEPTSHPPPGMVQVSAVRDASPASTVDSTKPASRSTRRCFDTVGCGIRSRRSISPTDCWDETRRLNIARRFGSAMISNTDSILFVYSTEHMLVKVYSGRTRGNGCTDKSSSSDQRSKVFWLLAVGDRTLFVAS